MRAFGSPRGAVAVVTCAGSGIGRAIALTFAERGSSVVLSDVNAARADAVTKGRFLVLTAPGVHDGMVERVADIEAYIDKHLAKNAGLP